MVEETVTLPAGLLKRAHVDQHRIKANAKNGTDLPVLTVQAKGGPYKGHEIIFDGPSKIVYDGSTLSCGAKVWLESHAKVTVVVREECEAAQVA